MYISLLIGLSYSFCVCLAHLSLCDFIYGAISGLSKTSSKYFPNDFSFKTSEYMIVFFADCRLRDIRENSSYYCLIHRILYVLDTLFKKNNFASLKTYWFRLEITKSNQFGKICFYVMY